MDIYSLTRKKRPSHLTLAKPSSIQSDTDSAVDISTKANFIEVTGSPTKSHWKNDSDASYCDHIGCSKSFGLFERRHHCRKCGDIFCSAHCSNYFRLDQFAQFHPNGSLSRGCVGCTSDYIQWQTELKNTNKKPKTTQQEDKMNSLLKRHAGIMTRQPQAMEGVTELGRDDIVSPKNPININKPDKDNTQVNFNPIPSVPADWQWSTF